MQDVVFVTIVMAFFALAAGAVRLCDRVVGTPDPQQAVAPSPDEIQVAA